VSLLDCGLSDGRWLVCLSGWRSARLLACSTARVHAHAHAHAQGCMRACTCICLSDGVAHWLTDWLMDCAGRGRPRRGAAGAADGAGGAALVEAAGRGARGQRRRRVRRHPAAHAHAHARVHAHAHAHAHGCMHVCACRHGMRASARAQHRCGTLPSSRAELAWYPSLAWLDTYTSDFLPERFRNATGGRASLDFSAAATPDARGCALQTGCASTDDAEPERTRGVAVTQGEH